MALTDFSEFVKVLASNIRRARLRLEFRQVDVAAKVGMNYRHYQNLESGTVNPKLETIHRLAGLFGHSVSELTATGISPFNFPGQVLLEDRTQLKVLDTLSIGAGMMDAEGKLIYLNSAMAKMFDLTLTQALGRSPVEFFEPNYRAQYLENVEKRKAGKPEPYFIEFNPTNGEKRLVFVHVQTYTSATGVFEGSLALVFDVTKAFAERMVMLNQYGKKPVSDPVS